MENINDLMNNFKIQLVKGDIQKAYKFLFEYIMKLRMYLEKKYPEYEISNNIYHGYMDMTYFPIFPKDLKPFQLKIALVFNYDFFRFELWLSAKNKDIQKKYWEYFSQIEKNKYNVVENIKGQDSIIEYIIDENVNFDDLDSLTNKIEIATVDFIKYIHNIIIKK